MRYEGICLGGPAQGLHVTSATPAYTNKGVTYNHTIVDLVCAFDLDDPAPLELFVPATFDTTPSNLAPLIRAVLMGENPR